MAKKSDRLQSQRQTSMPVGQNAVNSHVFRLSSIETRIDAILG